MEKNFQMLAKTFYGMEKILAVELKQLGAVDVYEGNRLVHFKGDKGFMYKANLCLRTALKILKPKSLSKIFIDKSLLKVFIYYSYKDISCFSIVLS